MAKDQNFGNFGYEWNIHLEGSSGDLTFKANGKNGDGDTRMAIDRTSGEVRIGGYGESGQLQLKDPEGANTIFLGGTETEANASLGGSAGRFGHVQLFDSSGQKTIDLNGQQGEIELGGEGVDGDLVVRDSSGTITITLNGDTTQVQMFDSSGQETIDLNGQQGEIELGGEGVDGDLVVRDSSGTPAIKLNGGKRRLDLFSEAGDNRASLQGDVGALKLRNSGEEVTVELRGGEARLTLGSDGAGGIVSGEVIVKDNQGRTAIHCNGETGDIECVNLHERPIPPNLTRTTVPLENALERVLSLRGVTCQREQATTPIAAGGSNVQQIGFVCQELETVCPELVATDAEGNKTVSYSRMTAILVEAIKEQQQQIREQAAALEAISERLGQRSTADWGAGQG